MGGYGITPKGQQHRRWARPLPPHPMTALERIRARRAELVGSHGQPPPVTRSCFKTTPPEQRR